MQLRRSDLLELHCIVPMANIASLLRLGILSHKRAVGVPHISVASNEVQRRRSAKRVPNGLPLHHYANLYIDARNPMMYVLKNAHLDLCVVAVSTDVLDLPDVVVADGNAASDWTRFAPAPLGLSAIDRDLAFAEWWDGGSEAKRVRCAEVLVPDRVDPTFVLGAYVSCSAALQQFEALELPEPRLPVTINEHLFYR